MRPQRPKPPPLPSPPPGRAGTGAPLPPTAPVKASQFVNAVEQSDVITPWLVTGGVHEWSLPGDAIPVPFEPQIDGAQLVTSIFIPKGSVGFLKEIRIAPLMPSVLADVFDTAGIQGQPLDPNWNTGGGQPAQLGELFGSYRNAAGAFNTYTRQWETPMGWETYRSWPGNVQPFLTAPPDPWQQQLAWQWQLTFVAGPLAAQRSANNIPPFSFLDPTSWYLVNDIPVPANVYANGFPGRPVGLNWGPQRYQTIPGEPLKTHVVIPENTTLCLFARWYNQVPNGQVGGQTFPPLVVSFTVPSPNIGNTVANVSLFGTVGDGFPAPGVPIIGPSLGSLHGYVQPIVSRGSDENAILGWGG